MKGLSFTPPTPATSTPDTSYKFERGYPSGDTAQKAFDDSDLSRAVEAYKFFYPTVSGHAIFVGNEKIGIVPNRVWGTLEGQPKHVGFTLNSDTPYAPALIDLSIGPMVMELPPGPLICIAMDVNQLWVADLGLPGPAAGKGDKVVFLPPDYKDKPPEGYRAAYSPSNTMLVGIRSLPVGGDVPAAIARIKTVKIHPLKATPDWPELQWLDLTPAPQDTTPLAWENDIQFWRELSGVIDSELPNPRFHYFYGELAELGIEKGKPFNPDARMTATLEKAARIGNAQMRVESFGDTRPDRIVWSDRKWEGPRSASRTATSTPPTTVTFTPATSGSIRPSEHRLPCSSVTRPLVRFTGWGCATPAEPLSTAVRPISFLSRSPFPGSFSGPSPSTTPRLAARSIAARAKQPSAPCLS
jgi:hypothetical protein